MQKIQNAKKDLQFAHPLLVVVTDFLLNGNPINFYIHRIQTFVGVLFMIALISRLLRRETISDIAFLSSSSFFLYVTHDPMLRFMRKLSLKLIDHNSEVQVIASYFGAIALDIAIVYAAYWILQKYAPGVLKWTTGR